MTTPSCTICGSTRDVAVLTTGNLCAVCDSLGRLYAAGTAYENAQYQRGVQQGYGGSVVHHSGPPEWAAREKRPGERVDFTAPKAVDESDDDLRMPPFGKQA